MKYFINHICRHSIRYSRRHIRPTLTAFIALMSFVSLLATQMAVAAHPCPVMMAAMAKPISANDLASTVTALAAVKIDVDADTNANANKTLLLPPCHMVGKSTADSQTDSEISAALCQQHCTADHRITGDASFQAPIPFIAAYEITIAPLMDTAEHAPDSSCNAIPIGLQHPVKPPPILAFGQLRI